MKNKNLIVYNSIEYHSIDIDRILFVHSEGNYCSLHLTCGVTLKMLPISLNEIAEQLRNITINNDVTQFVQIGRSIIVSINHIQSIYTSRRQIVFDEIDQCGMSRMSLQVSDILINRLRKLLIDHNFDTQIKEEHFILKEQDDKNNNEEVIIL